MAIQLLVTNENLAVQGDPLAGWTNLDCTLRFNEPGSGLVDLPAHPEVMSQLQPGNRLVVIRDGVIWMAGPMEIPTDFTWGVGGEGEPPPGRVTVSFADDLALPAGYLTWPLPGSAWTGQPVGNRIFVGTNAETIIRTLINENCGPGALTARRIPSLALGAVAGVGTSTRLNTRFEGLLEACRRVAAAGGGLGFRTRQAGSQILFEVYAPRDLRATARFSAGLGNLRAVSFKQSAPTTTHALVTGNENATPRAYVEVANTATAAAWWRVEQLVAAAADDDASGELTDEGTSALSDGAPLVELATVTVDTPDLRAGVHFGLGDRVTVALPTGVEVADLVRSIHLQATPDSGEYVTSLIGSPEATSTAATVRTVRELSKRLGRIETR